MPRNAWIPKAGDYCLKGYGAQAESGKVVERVSDRTGRRYLTVQITSGRRRSLHEFPERGWRLDDGTEAPVAGVRDTDTFVGSEAYKTRHHSRASTRFETPVAPLTTEQIAAATRQREDDEKEWPF